MMVYYAKSPPLVLLCAPLPLEGPGEAFTVSHTSPLASPGCSAPSSRRQA